MAIQETAEQKAEREKKEAEVALLAQQEAEKKKAQETLNTPRPASEEELRLVMQDNARQKQRADDLEARLKAIETPPKPVADRDKEFWASPTTAVAALVKEIVAPINAEIRESRQRGEYAALRDKIANSSPKAKAVFAAAGDIIEEVYTNQIKNGFKVGEQELELIVSGVYGQIELGRIKREIKVEGVKETTNAEPVKETRQMDEIPVHLRPSAAAAPARGGQQQQKIELSENEDRIRRERNMTPEQFIAWRDMPAGDVASSKLGKESK